MNNHIKMYIIELEVETLSKYLLDFIEIHKYYLNMSIITSTDLKSKIRYPWWFLQLGLKVLNKQNVQSICLIFHYDTLHYEYL